mmetsp:Transcript_10936/g.12497  ORF Transcript_10936/g.12497 Transcript_10936/m.12497 type:complete len:398 (+) Transcript_10936:165-1358(+)
MVNENSRDETQDNSLTTGLVASEPSKNGQGNRRKRHPVTASVAVASLMTGLIFGVAIDRAQLNVPFVIVKQLDMQNFTMLRMFLSASATSAVVITATNMLGLYKRVPKPITRCGFSYGGNVLGGLLLGIGMAISGACPGTVFAQIGGDPGLRTGLISLGGIMGTICFGYAEKKLRARNEDFLSKSQDPNTGHESLLNSLAVAAVATMAGIIYVVDRLRPWQGEMNQVIQGSVENVNPWLVWDPLLAGIVVGACQIPSILSSGGSFGMSSGWVIPSYFFASLIDSNVDENAPYLKKYVYSIFANWQLLTAIGAIIGSYISSTLFPTPTLSSQALQFQRSAGLSDFIGGFLLLVGARIGGGCTSGHGLSGIGLISTSSVVSVASMFLGGMATRALLTLM